MGIRVTLSFLGGLRGVCGFSRLPKVYMSHPMAPMKMSAGRSIITNARFRLRLTLFCTNSKPDYHSVDREDKL